jgi:type IV pilus assembly protein PilN
MARINLLPWREWERERRQKEFLGNLAGVLVLAGMLVFAGGWFLDKSVENQEARNNFLQTEINALDAQIAEIRDLQRKRAELLARMQVIQELQGNRPIIVRVFDEMVHTLAKGVHFRKLKMAGANLSVQGTAESNNRISALMRNLDGSDWFAQPNLKSIKEDPLNSNYGAQASTFDLTFVQVNPQKPAGEDNSAGED